MTAFTLQLRDNLIIQLLQANDETLIKRLHKSFCRIQAGITSDKTKEIEDEYISKEEILAGIDAGLKDIKAGRVMTMDELYKELQAI